MSEVEVKEMELFDWRTKVTEAQCKLKQQENLLESVVSERNLYSKNLIEAKVLMSSTAYLQFVIQCPVSQLWTARIHHMLLVY